jgi:hypothetical protein
MFPFFTFPSPLQVAFASTLTYDPHHDLQHPPSSLAASIWCFHVVTFTTFSELSPLFRNFRHFWVVFTFFTFPSPPHVAFASTLTYDPHHDLQHPPSSLAASIWCLYFLSGTFTELSPLLRNFRHFYSSQQIFSFEIGNNTERCWLCHGKVLPCRIHSDHPNTIKLFSPIFLHVSNRVKSSDKVAKVPTKWRKFRKF